MFKRANATKGGGLIAMFGATCAGGWKSWRLAQSEQPQGSDSAPEVPLAIDREAMLAVARGILEYVAEYKMIVDITCKRSFGRLPGTILVRDISDGSTGVSAINYESGVDRLAEVAMGGDRCMGEECYTGRFVARRDGNGDDRTSIAIAAVQMIRSFAEGAGHTFSFRWNKKTSETVIVFGDSEWPVEGVVDASLEYDAKKETPRKPETDEEKVAEVVMRINREFAKNPLRQTYA